MSEQIARRMAPLRRVYSLLSLLRGDVPLPHASVRPLPLRANAEAGLSHQSNWWRSCHPVCVYRPSPQSYDGRRDKYLPTLHYLFHLASRPDPTSIFVLLCCSLWFLRCPIPEHRHL